MIDIVRAGPALAGQTSAVGAQAFAEAFAARNTWADIVAHLERNYAPSVVARRMSEARSQYFLARDARGAVGMALLQSVGEIEGADARAQRFESPWVQLRQLYVLERGRNGGVGALLLRAAIDEGRSLGARSMRLGVWSENARAVRFYERHGFTVIGDETFLLGSDPQHDFVMACAIGAARTGGMGAARTGGSGPKP